MAFGSNSDGQCGLETIFEVDNITLVEGLPRNIVDVAIGYRFSLLLLSDGTVMSCGDNSCGQLGTWVSQRKKKV